MIHNKLGKGNPGEERIEWVRSELIGRDLEFETPFGRRILTYADQTASGRSLHYIENYITQQVLPFYGNTHTNDCLVGEKTTRMVNEATEYIRSCLGAGPDDALIFCGSGATAAIKRLQEVMGIAVPSNMRSRVLEILRDDERWVVFVGPFEHHSNLLSWRQSTAEVIEIGIDGHGMLDMEALELELGSIKYSNRPMLGSFSACSNVTGISNDTRALACLLHKYGAFACFDFATSGPYVEIDMRAGELEGYDAVFLSPHKFIGGPGSPGILLMNKALYLLRSFPPSTCGGGVVGYVNGFNPKGYSGLKPGWTRVSFGYYKSIEEFAFILDAIEFIASYGHRFLSLYHFDWATGDWSFQNRAHKFHLFREEILVEAHGFLGLQQEKTGEILRRRKDKSLQKYTKQAKRIALALPECPRPITVPDDVDPSLILFRTQ